MGCQVYPVSTEMGFVLVYPGEHLGILPDLPVPRLVLGPQPNHSGYISGAARTRYRISCQQARR